jgi:chondroitin 4-sulfotransferase 11
MQFVQSMLTRLRPRGADSCPALDDSPLRPGRHEPFVFIHINRTAGTSIGRAIGLPCKQHLTAREVIARVGVADWKRAYRFSIVRNPWDKVVSHYKHRVRTNQTGMGDRHIAFHEWVAATYGPDKRLPYYDQPKMFQPQVDWLRDHEGRVRLDFIGRFEDVCGAYRQIAGRLDLTGDLPHCNGTEKTDYRTFYDDRTAQSVGDWFAEDVATFGYRFDAGSPAD